MYRIIPYAAFNFYAYEQYRSTITRVLSRHVVTLPNGTTRVPPWMDLIAGSAAGATAVLATYPLDLVRTRMAWSSERVGGSQPHRSSISSTMIGIINREGVIGVYRVRSSAFVLAGIYWLGHPRKCVFLLSKMMFIG